MSHLLSTCPRLATGISVVAGLALLRALVSSFTKPNVPKFYRGKRVVITGASMGIGEGFALELAKYNTKLVLAARSVEKLEQVADKCRQASPETECLTVRCDVTNPEDCKNLIDQAVEKFGGIDVLILNAGVAMYCLFEETTNFDIFSSLMDTNYYPNVRLTQYALPILKKNKGSIAVVSSGCGLFGVPLRTGYDASKHAVNGFFKALRVELGPKPDVNITILHVPLVNTEIAKHMVKAGNDILKHSRAGMPVAQCVSLSLAAVAAKKRDEFFDFKTWSGRYFELWFPNFLDNKLREEMYASLEGK